MKDNSVKRVFNRLPVLRAERGLGRQELADALDVNYQTVGYLERGDYNPSLELALRLSEYFVLPVEAIFSLRPFRPLSEELYAGVKSAKFRPSTNEAATKARAGR